MRSVLLFSFLAFCSVASGQIINFPDDNFKNALVNTKCVDTNSDNIGDSDADLNNDGEIDVSEALMVEKLIVFGRNIISLEGIHHFKSLTIIRCRQNKFTSLNFENLLLLVELDCAFNNNLNTLRINNLPKLSVLSCSETLLTSLELNDLPELSKLECDKNKFMGILTMSNLPKLMDISCQETGLIKLDLIDLPELLYLNCNLNKSLIKLTLINLPKFKGLSCDQTSLPELDLIDLPFLSNLHVDQNYLLRNLTLNNLPKLEQVFCTSNNLKELSFKDLPSLSLISISETSITGKLTFANLPKLGSITSSNTNFEQIKEVEVNNLPNLSSIGFENATLSEGITLTNLPKLSSLFFEDTNLTTLDIKDLPKLSLLQCYGNTSLNKLSLKNLQNLYTLKCVNSGSLTLELNDLPLLSSIDCSYSKSLKLRLSNLPKLDRLDCDNSNITVFVLENLELLSFINCSYDKSLDSLKLSNLPKLVTLLCDNSILKEITLDSLPLLSSLACGDNKSLKKIILTNLPKLSTLKCANSNLFSITMISQNILSKFEFINNPNLQYICCSEVNYPLVKNNLILFGYTNVNVTNYCSFDPFSDFGVLSGNVKYDITNNNGCDENDINLTSNKFNINGVNTSGEYSFLGYGKYDVSLKIGSYKITPIYDYQHFKVTPEFVNVDIKKGDTITQDFCITPKGIFRQTNITVIPLTPPARPGFDAQYKIVWENVGNQIESGTLNFTYDETLLDYISATQTADQVADGIIKWNFTSLLPFEKREITVTLKVNRPTDTPAVNAGNKLYLTASILDNIFTLENTVVGSYDPNDKTCLQGDRVKPDMVGEYVDYLIRFENTGNFAAENVVVKDIIDTKTFEISTLKITDASHEVYTRIEGNKVEFIFENIQLPFEDANNDGYIAFKIKTLPSLVLGDSLKNLADIYFDYNFPIRTNEAQTTVAFPVITKDITTEVNIYPNPVTDVLNLDSNDHWSKAEIFDIAGRIMRSISLNGQSMDVSGLESGTYFIRLKDGEEMGLVKFVKI